MRRVGICMVHCTRRRSSGVCVRSDTEWPNNKVPLFGNREARSDVLVGYSPACGRRWFVFASLLSSPAVPPLAIPPPPPPIPSQVSGRSPKDF